MTDTDRLAALLHDVGNGVLIEHGLWPRNFVMWDEVAARLIAAGVTLAIEEDAQRPTPPDAPHPGHVPGEWSCSQACFDAAPTPPDALLSCEELDDLNDALLIAVHTTREMQVNRDRWEAIRRKVREANTLAPTPPDALDVERLYRVIADIAWDEATSSVGDPSEGIEMHDLRKLAAAIAREYAALEPKP